MHGHRNLKFTVTFSEKPKFPVPYKESVPLKAISVCVFFPPFFRVCLCAESSHLSLAKYVHRPVLLDNGKGVLKRQPAASESIFRLDYILLVFFC